MSDDRAVRLKAGLALARALADPATRNFFAENDYVSEQQIILALESDTVEQVFDRMREYPPPVTVAVYWPENGKLRYSSFAPDSWAAGEPDQADVGVGGTIGMLFEYNHRQENPHLRIRVDRQTLTAAPFVGAVL